MRKNPPLWPHQRRVIEAAEHTLQNSHGCMLALPMGTGKSRIALEVMGRFGARRLLIIGPKTVCSDAWPEQLAKWSRLHLVDGYSGVVRERIGRINEAGRRAAETRQGCAVVVNYDVIARPEMTRCLMRYMAEGVIFDESHRIATPGTKRSKAARQIAANVLHRMALSGTPISTGLGPLGIWSQYRALDPQVYEEPTFGAFRRRYTRPVIGGDEKHHGVVAGRGGSLEFYRYRNMTQLKNRMRLLAHRVKADEVLDLPGEMDRNLVVRLSPKGRKAYRQLLNDLVAELSGGHCTVPIALTRLLRLQQLTGGHLPVDDGPLERVCSAKELALRDLMADVPDERIVVMAQFHADLDVIKSCARACERGSFELSGRVNQLADWRRDPRGVLAVQIQAGSEGISLTDARHCVWYSCGFSLVSYDQARARLHRPGQQLPVIHTHLLAEATVDLDVMKALAGKQSVAETVLAGLRN